MVQFDFIYSDEIYFIDIVEMVVIYYVWDFDWFVEDQIVMVVEGQWCNYLIMFVWLGCEEVLCLICIFDMDLFLDKLFVLYEVLNLVNDQVWDGGFIFWVL